MEPLWEATLEYELSTCVYKLAQLEKKIYDLNFSRNKKNLEGTF